MRGVREESQASRSPSRPDQVFASRRQRTFALALPVGVMDGASGGRPRRLWASVSTRPRPLFLGLPFNSFPPELLAVHQVDAVVAGRLLRQADPRELDPPDVLLEKLDVDDGRCEPFDGEPVLGRAALGVAAMVDAPVL
jgi:hypothetical protein